MFPTPSSGFPPIACQPQSNGWDYQPTFRAGRAALRYTYVVMWASNEGRVEWYDDFAKGATESYERLGHIVDRFRLLVLDVESLIVYPT